MQQSNAEAATNRQIHTQENKHKLVLDRAIDKSIKCVSHMEGMLLLAKSEPQGLLRGL